MPKNDTSKKNRPRAEVDVEPEEVEQVSAPEPAGETVAVSYDPASGLAGDSKEVAVSVGNSGVVKLPVDGASVNVNREVAELVLQNPAVKESK